MHDVIIVFDLLRHDESVLAAFEAFQGFHLLGGIRVEEGFEREDHLPVVEVAVQVPEAGGWSLLTRGEADLALSPKVEL